MKKRMSPILRSALLGFGILLAFVIYAYGFKVTKVNLEETRSENRQTQLVRIIRALAQPDLVTYKQDEVQVNTQIMVPCPADGFEPAEVDKSGPYIVVTPSCAEPGAKVMVEGFNFAAGTKGPLNFIPPSAVSLQLGSIEPDDAGHFIQEVKLPKRPSEEIQRIRAITRQRVGGPILSQTAKDTWDKIIETVFLALLATTFGTALAIPLSFFAARNLMKDITDTLLSVSMNVLLIPLGIWAGANLAGWLGSLSQSISELTLINLAGVVIGPVLAVGAARYALPPEDIEKPNISVRFMRLILIALAVLLAILSLYFLSSFLIGAGRWLVPQLGSFGFLGTFITDVGDIIGITIAVVTALAGGGVGSAVAARLGLWSVKKLPLAVNKLIMVLISGAAGALLFVLVAAGIDWLYQINDPMAMIWIPAIVGGVLGLAGGLFLKPRDQLPIGMVIYNISRTVLNGLRSIEALIMVIVFVVWVGIGPFAGVLALSLHTIATLAKLYSEQIESIMAGPLEAVTATGANRLQTVIYAVIPQIIPPYISFTMYRWDINVRMSTIIGFAGGGGIGFLLIQNINLLNYRAASAQMLAIAIVVATMDYLSSEMRERVV